MKINRRQMITGLAAGGSGLPGQFPAAPESSLYMPKAHLVEDRKLLHDFMDEYAFVDLISSLPTLRITHIPVILDRNAGTYGRILGHVARQNPQSQVLDGRHPCVIVFRGPHAYISPTWYARTDGVPTWNFAVVHASGSPVAIADKAVLHDLLARLVDKFEKRNGSKYDFSGLPDSHVTSLMNGMVGFEMPIDALEGKFKLGQDRSYIDKQGVLGHLRQEPPHERTIYDFTMSFYQRTRHK